MNTSLILLFEKIHYSGSRFLLIMIAGLYLEKTMFLKQIYNYSIIIGFLTICHFGLDTIISYRLSKNIPVYDLLKIRLIGSFLSSFILIIVGVLDSIYSIIFVSIALLGVAAPYEQLKALGTGNKEGIIKYRLYPELFSFIYRIFFLAYFFYNKDYGNGFFYFSFFTTEFAYGLIVIYKNTKKLFVLSEILNLEKDLLKLNIDLIIKSTVIIAIIYYFQRSDILISNFLNESSNIKKITIFQQIFDSAGILILALTPVLNKIGEISNKLINHASIMLAILGMMVIFLIKLDINLALPLIGIFSLAAGLASYAIIHILQIKNKINTIILSLAIASIVRSTSFFLAHYKLYTFDIHIITTFLVTLLILLLIFKSKNYRENI